VSLRAASAALAKGSIGIDRGASKRTGNRATRMDHAPWRRSAKCQASLDS
jgi:hypothetical protein